MNNNYVAMEYKQCPVCYELHTHDCGILINKRLKDIKPTYEGKVVTGHSLCQKHDNLFRKGFLALVEVNNTNDNQERLQVEDARLSGRIAHLKRNAVEDMFSYPIPNDIPMVYIDKEVMDMLVEMDITER